MEEPIEIPLFPLNVVLFPGGRLPLKIFEQRYVDMVKRAISERTSFGVVSTTGSDTARTADFAKIGTAADITEWDVPNPGIFHLITTGFTRFVVEESWMNKDGLNVGRVRMLANEPATMLTEDHRALQALLQALVEKAGQARFPAPLKFDDASWVSMRLAEVLPLSLKVKQHMLEVNDAHARLTAIAQFLAHHDIVKKK